MAQVDGDSGRRPSFSQRHGHADFDPVVQVESLDERARTDLWNFLVYPKYIDQTYPATDGKIIWCNHLALPLHAYKQYDLSERLRVLVFSGEWFKVYDLLEFFALYTSDFKREQFNELVNNILAVNRAGYRLLDRSVVPITIKEELATVGAAVESPLSSAAGHIKKAVALFAVRDNPNYAKAVQEAMSGAEAAAHELSYGQGQTLVESLNFVSNKLPKALHNALIDGWKMLYGFTGDSGGIRHAAKGDTVEPGQDLTLYFIVTCSAFVNLVTSVVAKRTNQPT